MAKNKDLFDKMVKAQQSQYWTETKLTQRIESYFKELGFDARATLGEYNYIKITVDTSIDNWEMGDCRTERGNFDMCDFSINDFLKEFDFEVSSYEHGWRIFYTTKRQISQKIFWRFWVTKRSDLDV